MNRKQSQMDWDVIRRMPRCTFTLAYPALCSHVDDKEGDAHVALATHITMHDHTCQRHWLEDRLTDKTLLCSYCYNRGIDHRGAPKCVPATAQIHYGPLVENLCQDCYQLNYDAFMGCA